MADKNKRQENTVRMNSEEEEEEEGEDSWLDYFERAVKRCLQAIIYKVQLFDVRLNSAMKYET